MCWILINILTWSRYSVWTLFLHVKSFHFRYSFRVQLRSTHKTFPATKRFLLQNISCHKTFLESGEKNKPSQSAGVISEKWRLQGWDWSPGGRPAAAVGVNANDANKTRVKTELPGEIILNLCARKWILFLFRWRSSGMIEFVVVMSVTTKIVTFDSCIFSNFLHFFI